MIITSEQLLEAGAYPNCIVYRKFVSAFGGRVEFEWTLEKQLELLRDPVWRTVLGWLWEKKILKMLSMRGGIHFQGADLFWVDLCGADWIGANLKEANMFEANLSMANLTGANLKGVNLRGANLHRVNLFGANLHAADLRGAYLKWANLNRTNLNQANLRGADLTGAYLSGANLHGVCSDEHTVWPEGFEDMREDKDFITMALQAINDEAAADAWEWLEREKPQTAQALRYLIEVAKAKPAKALDALSKVYGDNESHKLRLVVEALDREPMRQETDP